MKDVKELALKVAIDVGVWQVEPSEVCFTEARLTYFATRLIAAYCAEQKPDCWAVLTPNGSKLVSPEEAKGLLKAYPLFTAPPLTEPAPQTDGSTIVSAPNQESCPICRDTGKTCCDYEPTQTAESAIAQLVTALQQSKGWMRDYADSIIRDAIDRNTAPSSEEVREMVERLYSDLDGGPSGWLKQEAADMIERLAARVPEGCVVVPREPTEAMIGNEWNRDMLTGIWKAMIAAGEVK